MRFWRRAVAAGLATAAVLVPNVGAHTESVYVGELAIDTTLFWEAEGVGNDPAHSLPFMPSSAQVDRCTVPEHPCDVYEFDVREAGAASLRVGFDTPERDDGFEIVVESPSGERTRSITQNEYSLEVFLPAPAVGLWHVYVAPYSAEDAPYRMRAKLEREFYIPEPDAEGYLLPNLLVTRTWEFGFAAPINPLNGPFLAPDDANPPLAAGPVQPVSCSPDETVDDGATTCLRYSFGLGNGGLGPLNVRWIGDEFGEGHEVYQCLSRGDGTLDAHLAGTGSFHQTHGHWHYDDIVWHRLYSVGADGSLTPAGVGKKIGYSPADQGLVGWESFTQDRPGTSALAGDCVPGSNHRLGLSRGWGDAYRYQRAGNYVDFNVNGDGDYVVHTIVDPMGNLRESDRSDNTYYTHIRVKGAAVDVLEQGYGESPWDPAKRVVSDWWLD